MIFVYEQINQEATIIQKKVNLVLFDIGQTYCPSALA